MTDGGLLHGERLYVDKLMTFPIFCWFVKKYFVMLRMTGLNVSVSITHIKYIEHRPKTSNENHQASKHIILQRIYVNGNNFM